MIWIRNSAYKSHGLLKRHRFSGRHIAKRNRFLGRHLHYILYILEHALDKNVNQISYIFTFIYMIFFYLVIVLSSVFIVKNLQPVSIHIFMKNGENTFLSLFHL